MRELESTLLAALKERIYFFKKDNYKRTDAIALILMIDCCWQVLRNKLGIEKGNKVHKSIITNKHEIIKKGVCSKTID